ncbi:MAG: phosphate acyltransferase PlsX [candidate division Zixibacteria bacterium]
MTDSRKIRIAIDAMGGDHAPFSIIEGAVQAQKAYGKDVALILVGDSAIIKNDLKKLNSADIQIRIVHSDEVIGMSDEPAESVRTKKNSSIVVGMELQKNGECDAFISAGNTGAVMAASLLILGRLKGVNRPAIGIFFPNEKGRSLVLDVGANSDCKAINLYQFAIMGSIYFSHMFSSKNPTVGLLSIGEEKSKGNELTIESHKMISGADLNFIGNLEGRDILKGRADVVVCDGFVGNIILKFAESINSFFKESIRRKIKVNPFAQIGALLLKPAFRDLKKNLDYSEYGGAPLLGVNGVSIICHGGSSAKAIRNAVVMARTMVTENVNNHIEQRVKINGDNKSTETEIRQHNE